MRSLTVNVRRQVNEADPDRMADAKVCQFAALTQAVDDRGAHAEELCDVADRKQRCARNWAGEIL